MISLPPQNRWLLVNCQRGGGVSAAQPGEKIMDCHPIMVALLMNRRILFRDHNYCPPAPPPGGVCRLYGVHQSLSLSMYFSFLSVCLPLPPLFGMGFRE